MSRDNSVTVIGNLVEDPEMRFTPSGVGMAKIRVAVSRKWKSGDEWQEETSFFSGMLWRELAERAADSLHKGDRVIISGEIEQRTWENDQGEKRSAVELRIDDIGPSLKYATAFVTRAQRESSSAPASAPPPVPRDDYGPDEAPF